MMATLNLTLYPIYLLFSLCDHGEILNIIIHRKLASVQRILVKALVSLKLIMPLTAEILAEILNYTTLLSIIAMPLSYSQNEF